MNSFYSTYNYNARLDRISIDRSIEPIKKEATLRLSKQNIPTAVANGSTVQPSTDQHLMEVHVDGRLLARWDLNQLTRRTSGAIPGLIARSFSSFKLERIIQLVLPLPIHEEEKRLPSASQTNPSHLKIIRFHLNTHQEFHTVIRYLSKDAGFHHQETLGLRSLSVMSLSNGRVPGPHTVRHSPIGPSDRPPSLVLTSGPVREVPHQIGPTAFSLDHDPPGRYYSRSQDSATPWHTAGTWSSGIFAHSSPIPSRPATVQPYQKFSTQSLRRDRPSRMDNEQRWDSSRRFSGGTIDHNALEEGASRQEARSIAATNSAPRSSRFELRDQIPRRFQNPDTTQENVYDLSLDPRIIGWRSITSMKAYQDGIDPLDGEEDMPAPTKPRDHAAHLRSEDTIGSDNTWTQSAVRSLLPGSLASEAPIPRHLSRPNSNLNLHANEKRISLIGKPGLGNITPAKQQELQQPTVSIPAGSAVEFAGLKRPLSRQSDSHSVVKRPRKTPSSVCGPLAAQHGTLSPNRTVSASRTLTANRVVGLDFINAEGTGLESAKAVCMRCRRTHTKCDRFLPACGSCVKAGRVCTYPHNVIKSGLDSDDRENFQNQQRLRIDASRQEEASIVPQEGSSDLRQPRMQNAMDQNQDQRGVRSVAEMIDAGTSSDVVFVDIATQTNRPLRLQMDLSQWTDLVKSAVELHQSEVDAAAGKLEEAERTSPEIREMLLKVARMGWNLAQNLRGLYEASSNHPERSS